MKYLLVVFFLLLYAILNAQSSLVNYSVTVQGGSFDYYSYAVMVSSQGYGTRKEILDIESRRTGWREVLNVMELSLGFLPFRDDFLRHTIGYGSVLATMKRDYFILGRSGASGSATVHLAYTLGSADFLSLYSDPFEAWEVVFDTAFLAEKRKNEVELRRKVRDRHNSAYQTIEDFKKITRVVFLVPRTRAFPCVDFFIYMNDTPFFSYRNIHTEYRGKPLFRFKSGFNYASVKKTYETPVYYIEAALYDESVLMNENPALTIPVLYGIRLESGIAHTLYSNPVLRELLQKGDFEIVFCEDAK